MLVFFRLSGQRDKKCVLYKMNRGSIIVKIVPQSSSYLLYIHYLVILSLFVVN